MREKVFEGVTTQLHGACYEVQGTHGDVVVGSLEEVGIQLGLRRALSSSRPLLGHPLCNGGEAQGEGHHKLHPNPYALSAPLSDRNPRRPSALGLPSSRFRATVSTSLSRCYLEGNSRGLNLHQVGSSLR